MRVLEKHVPSGVGTRHAEKSQVKSDKRVQADGLREYELFRLFVSPQEDCNAIDGQRSAKTIQN